MLSPHPWLSFGSLGRAVIELHREIIISSIELWRVKCAASRRSGSRERGANSDSSQRNRDAKL